MFPGTYILLVLVLMAISIVGCNRQQGRIGNTDGRTAFEVLDDHLATISDEEQEAFWQSVRRDGWHEAIRHYSITGLPEEPFDLLQEYWDLDRDELFLSKAEDTGLQAAVASLRQDRRSRIPWTFNVSASSRAPNGFSEEEYFNEYLPRINAIIESLDRIARRRVGMAPGGDEGLFSDRVRVGETGARWVDITYDQLLAGVRQLAAEGVPPEEIEARMGFPAVVNTANGESHRCAWRAKGSGFGLVVRTDSDIPIRDLCQSAVNAAYWGGGFRNNIYYAVGILWTEDGTAHVFEGEELPLMARETCWQRWQHLDTASVAE